MNSNNLSTKDEIMMMLKMNGSLTVSDIAKDLGITEMAVRRHLNTLERDEFIRSSLVRQAMGRPTNLYSLTEKAENQFPKAYQTLAIDIIDGFFEEEGLDKVKEIFDRRELKLRKAYKKKLQGLETLAERVNGLIDIQTEKGYLVETEEDEDGYFIKEYNCPISEVAKVHNFACDGEKKLFKNVLDAEVDLVKCMARGDHNCVYFVKK